MQVYFQFKGPLELDGRNISVTVRAKDVQNPIN